MEIATLVVIFISGLLVSFIGYALYTIFRQPSGFPPPSQPKWILPFRL